jgi:hypothetical protein
MLQAKVAEPEAMTAIKTWIVSRKGKIIKFGLTQCRDQLRDLMEESVPKYMMPGCYACFSPAGPRRVDHVFSPYLVRNCLPLC